MIEEVYKASSIEETLNILESKENTMIIAGGTDLIVQMRKVKLNKSALIDISDIKELKEIIEEEEIIRIGSGVTFNELVNSTIFNGSLYGIKKAASQVGSPQIRSRGTIGGNICNNSQSADLIPPLLALDAKLVIQSKSEARKVYLEDFLIDKNVVDIKENEIITHIEIKKLNENQRLSFSKLGYRESLAIAKISASVLVNIQDNKFKDITIALGAVNKTAIRAYEAESYLSGKEVNEENIDNVLELLGKKVEEDLKGRESVYFKSHAIKGIVENAILQCI